MAYLKIEEAKKEQIREMRKDKSPQEIIDFFKHTYQIEINPRQIDYICNGKAPKRVRTIKRSSRKRRRADKPTLGDDALDALLLEIKQRMEHTRQGYGQVFKAMRKEVIKSQAEVQRMKKGLGISLLPGEEEVIESPENQE